MSGCAKDHKHRGQILVVDDSPGSLKLLTDFLGRHGYQVRPAADGHLALRSVAVEAPDLILLDVLMPGMDGYEVCRRLKADQQSRHIPVIFISGLDEVVDKLKGFEAGGVDYISKPFDPDDLLARVTTHLTLRRLQQEVEAQNRELGREIAERKKAEEALHQIHAELERRVAERTVELAQANARLKVEISEHRRTERELMRLVTAIEQAAEGIFTTDSNYIIQYANPAFERMTGYDRSELIGQHTRMLKSDRHGSEYYAGIRRCLIAGGVWSGRHTSRRKDGTYYVVEVTATPVRERTGDIINYVGIHRDVTHEVKLEAELRQAQKMEAIGTLAGGIAHDFNNILAAIVGYTEMARSRVPPDSSALRNLDQVLKASHRATDLVKQILAFSRQREQERRPLQIAPIIKEGLRLLRSSLPTTIEIRHNLAGDREQAAVLADPTQIHQVLINLCTNAAHAMRTTGGVLEVTITEAEIPDSAAPTRVEGAPVPYVKLTVSDTGHGMEAAVKERIFEPYFTTKQVGEGTGLGLAVVQGIVRSHRGMITVESEPGRGTTFEVLLPRIEREPPQHPAAPEQLLTGSERILFVDDEQTMTDLGREMLEPLGYQVTTKTSSSDALETFQTQPDAFDLVITDMTMPGLTGSELARRLMAIRADIPIILCTGFSDLIDQKLAEEAGIRAFVMKPYVIANLTRIIRELLDHH